VFQLRTRRRLLTGVFAVLVVLLVSLVVSTTAFDGSHPNHARRSTTSALQPTTATTNAASSQSWLNFGLVVIANRQNGSLGDPPADTFGPYLSQPVDITANGTYSIIIGPLSVADAQVPVIPGLHLPYDVTFTPGLNAQMTTFTGSDGQTYGEFSLTVSDLTAPYNGLTVWAD
jgi:hypothetical protein